MSSSVTTCLALSQDEKLLATGHEDASIYLWDLETHKHLATFKGHHGSISGLIFSPDNSQLISSSDDKTIRSRRIDISSPSLFGYHDNSITSIKSTLDGKIVVSGSSDKTVKIWFVENKFESMSLGGFTSPITSLDIEEKDKKLAIASLERNIRIRSLLNGKIISSIPVESGVSCLKFSPDGRFLAFAGYNHELKLWDLINREFVFSLSGHQNVISSLAFSKNGQKLISASWDETIKIWQVNSGELVDTLNSRVGPIRAMTSTKRDLIVTSGYHQYLETWIPKILMYRAR